MLLLPNGAAHLQLVVQWLAALGLDYFKLFLACSPLLVIEARVTCLLLRVALPEHGAAREHLLEPIKVR